MILSLSRNDRIIFRDLCLIHKFLKVKTFLLKTIMTEHLINKNKKIEMYGNCFNLFRITVALYFNQFICSMYEIK